MDAFSVGLYPVLFPRAKYTRMFIIQSQILRGLGVRQQPNVTGRKVTKTDIGVISRYVQKLNETNRRYNTESMYAERLLVYNPSCETPPRTHKAWRDPDSFRLYFPLEPPAENPTVQSRLMSAQLRLYKTGCNCTKDSDDDEDQGIDDGGVGGSKKGEGNKNKSLRRAKRILRKSKRQKFARSLKRGKKRRQSKNKRSRSNRGRGQMMDDDADDELRVTVFWFRKPIKRDAKAKKQLAGSVMVRRSQVGWVEINIKTPVKRWVKRPNKNFGIEVRVEDANQRKVDPFTVFKGFECTSENGEDNIYFNLGSLNEVLLLNETLYNQNYNMTHPTLEIAHVDVPVTVTRPKRQTSETCVLKKEFFSMEELGLNDWIIAPGGIALGICEGHCLPAAPGAHYDADRLVINQNGQKGCCGPTELESFTFLQIMDDNRIAISSIPDFIVTKCGCRM
ncbi:hypothetical protein LSH36_99g05041 [Paralvinella palmiformis]|uniref:TGF-beta family profile domain-containing protein n=1 Tax=Paralvinella palmiformis TaxID=53620 RepID=A0AAD9NBT4_9ANNE|nr:hypothetical protein LSH36_99g05041 [Paralvinella palmiformis]